MGRIAAVKAQKRQASRPPAKAIGRWLGDFLGDAPNDSLPAAELRLLYGCSVGEDVNKSSQDYQFESLTEAQKAARRNAIRGGGIDKRKAELRQSASDNRVRAGFLRFLILGGDDSAPVHEKGIQLWNTMIHGDLDLRSGKCVSRIALIKCILEGELRIQDANFDVLLLSGSWLHAVAQVAGALRANRAKISGAMWLDENFIADGEVELFGVEIGGRLDCSFGYFGAGIAAPGARIGGDVTLSGVAAAATVSFVNAKIGGSVNAISASFTSKNASAAALDFSRANVNGDVSLLSATVSPAAWTPESDARAIDAQNSVIRGSLSFGGDFTAKGLVYLYCAEISKDLVFAGSTFDNRAGFAILADSARVAGCVYFWAGETGEGNPRFRAFGPVSLRAVTCGDLTCRGARFQNLKAKDNPEEFALDCTLINIARVADFSCDSKYRFFAVGKVSFQAARIGQNLECLGGSFFNPRGVALYCESANISGVVYLGVGLSNCSEQERRDRRAFKFFRAAGQVSFLGATVGFNLICALGQFRTPGWDPETGFAKTALNLSMATIGNALVLGRETLLDLAPVIRGSVDLSGATVRILIDDGFGLRKVLAKISPREKIDMGKRSEVIRPKPVFLPCHLFLDQFTYDRLRGGDAYDATLRKLWLNRQPPANMGAEFKPQPFAQLVNVMRAMGYNDDADDIALSKRQHERRASTLRSIAETRGRLTIKAVKTRWSLFVNALERVFIDWFIGYGYHMGRAVFVLLVVCLLAAGVDDVAFHHGMIVPADQSFRDAHSDASTTVTTKFTISNSSGSPAVSATSSSATNKICLAWTPAACPDLDKDLIPRFQPLVYAADVIIPIVGFGQKAAWEPANDARWLYWLQIVEMIIGWVGGALLAAFVTGLLGKE